MTLGFVVLALGAGRGRNNTPSISVMLSYLFVFKVYLDTDHFPISIATMLVSKE